MKKKIICIVLLICILLTNINVDSIYAKSISDSRKDIKKEINTVTTKLKKLKAQKNKIIKGSKYIEISTVISNNPFIVEQQHFLGGSTYYYINNPDEAVNLFGFFTGYLKPTGRYKTFNGITCVETKYISVPTKLLKDIEYDEELIKTLKHYLSDYVKLIDFKLRVGEKANVNDGWKYGGEYDEVTFKSSNSKVVKVDKKGNIIAKKLGEATITAISKYSKKTNTCNITVVNEADDLMLDQYEINLPIGERYQINYTLNPIDATDKVYFKSDDPSIADVNEDGSVMAYEKGTTYIKVYTESGLVKKCKVIVSDDVYAMKFYKESVTVGGYNRLGLYLDVLPDFKEKDIIYVTSSNKEVIEDGVVNTAMSKAGNARVDAYVTGVGTTTITVTADSGITSSCEVTIVSMPSEINRILNTKWYSNKEENILE